jgi:hypothetical protein
MPKLKSAIWPCCCLFLSRLCPKRQKHKFRVSALRGCSTVNSSLTGGEADGRELPSLMRQLAQSRHSSQHSLSLRYREEDQKRQLSLASGRSFYRKLMTKHQGEVICARGPEDYHDVAGVLILREQLRIAESREVKEKLPGLRPRLNTA